MERSRDPQMSTVFNHSVIRSPKWTVLPLPPDLLSRTLLPDICQMAGLFYSLTFSFHASCSKKGSISDIGCKGTCCLYSNGVFRNRAGFVILNTMDLVGHIIHSPGGACRCLLASSTSIHCPHPGFPSPQDSLR